MSKWEEDKTPIENFYIGFFDGPHATPQFVEEGPIFLGIKNITEDGRLDLTETNHLSEKDFQKWTRRVTPQPGDIVFTYEAALHKYAVIPTGFRGCLGRRLALVRPNPQKADSQFLLYYFLGNYWKALITSKIFSGSTVDRIPLIDFPKFEVSIPPLPVQRKIAAVLSAYDDLIENNTRRIALLEKMAEEIYREWFVRLRFPGHEQVTFHKGIPAGWDVAQLGEIAEKSGGVVQTGPFGAQLHQSDYQSDGIPVIMPKDIQGNRINFETVAFISEQLAQKLSRHILQKGDIVFPRRGDLSKRFLVTANEDGWLCGTGCLKISIPSQALSPWYLFYFLSQSYIADFIESKAIGATMANLNASILKSVELLCPSYSVQEKFDRVIEPILEQVTRLDQVNQYLKKLRDRLLTRLISGKLSVKDLDIHFPPSMTAETPHDG